MLSFGRFSGRAPFVQRPRTPAFHAGNTGSNPVRGTPTRPRANPPMLTSRGRAYEREDPRCLALDGRSITCHARASKIRMDSRRAEDPAVPRSDVPDEASDEVTAPQTGPFSQLSGHPSVPLGTLLDELFAHAVNPDLLEVRECARPKPTYKTLGQELSITGEAVRRRIARDTELILDSLNHERFRPVRWAAEQLRAELGHVIPSTSEIPERWRTRLGDRGFEMLRWVAGYVYEDDWLLQGRSALADFTAELADIIGDEWLVDFEALLGLLSVHVHSQVVLGILVDTGQWREIGDEWLVRWDGTIQHKAERVLRLTCRPMSPEELIEAVGHGSVRSLKNNYRPTLVRIDKEFTLALREWGYEGYEGITSEIAQRIDRGGGVASVSAMLEEFVSAFGVKERSVRAYLEGGPYIISGDEVRLLPNRGYTPTSVSDRQHAVQIRGAWGQRFTVTDKNLRGYSFDLDRDIAAHNGLQPEASLVVPATHSGTVVGEASLIWRRTFLRGTVDVGRLSRVLKRLEIGEGDEIVIVATPESCAVLRDDEAAQQRT